MLEPCRRLEGIVGADPLFEASGARAAARSPYFEPNGSLEPEKSTRTPRLQGEIVTPVQSGADFQGSPEPPCADDASWAGGASPVPMPRNSS
jgi:hypothetical protein